MKIPRTIILLFALLLSSIQLGAQVDNMLSAGTRPHKKNAKNAIASYGQDTVSSKDTILHLRQQTALPLPASALFYLD